MTESYSIAEEQLRELANREDPDWRLPGESRLRMACLEVLDDVKKATGLIDEMKGASVDAALARLTRIRGQVEEYEAKLTAVADALEDANSARHAAVKAATERISDMPVELSLWEKATIYADKEKAALLALPAGVAVTGLVALRAKHQADAVIEQENARLLAARQQAADEEMARLAQTLQHPAKVLNGHLVALLPEGLHRRDPVPVPTPEDGTDSLDTSGTSSGAGTWTGGGTRTVVSVPGTSGGTASTPWTATTPDTVVPGPGSGVTPGTGGTPGAGTTPGTGVTPGGGTTLPGGSTGTPGGVSVDGALDGVVPGAAPGGGLVGGVPGGAGGGAGAGGWSSSGLVGGAAGAAALAAGSRLTGAGGGMAGLGAGMSGWSGASGGYAGATGAGMAGGRGLAAGLPGAGASGAGTGSTAGSSAARGTGLRGAAGLAGESGAASSAATRGGTGAGTSGTMMGHGGAGGAGSSSKERRRGLGGPIAPRLEDEEEIAPRSPLAGPGQR